jgi:hypothetical protein
MFEINKKKVEDTVRKNIQTSLIDGKYSPISPSKLYSYDELKLVILEKWPSENYHFTTSDNPR